MIIGISGKIGSGKDTLGTMLQGVADGYPDDFIIERVKAGGFHPNHVSYEIKKFAGKLKQVTSIITGIPVEDLENPAIKHSELGEEWDLLILNKYDKEGNNIKTSYTVRKMLQRIGTEAMRKQIHPDVWVNALFADYLPQVFTSDNRMTERWPDWIITDVRFPNEAKAIKDRNGILIRINRQTIESVTSEFFHGIEGVEQHPSETSLDDWDDWDFIVDNNEGFEELLQTTYKIYNSL